MVTNLSRCDVPFERVNGWDVEMIPMVLCGWNRMDPSVGVASFVLLLLLLLFVVVVISVLVIPEAVAVVVAAVAVMGDGGAVDCELVVEDSSESDIFL